MKRLRIEHETGFRYAGAVTASYNEARMLPGVTDSQFVLSSGLDIHPAAAVNAYVDYFGTRVTSFDVLSPHEELRIVSRSLVEVRPRPVRHPDITWDRLAADADRSIDTVELRGQTDRTRPHAEVAEIARVIADRHDNPSEAAQEIAAAIGEAVEYMPGVTGVQSTAAEAWEARKGVCQDITHIALGALRSVGVPARYVSGYLHPRPDADIGEPVTGESHAWIEWWAGGWQGWDPTNGVEIGDRHVSVGHGRDYNDVPPLRGVYAGPFKSELYVTVTITREA
ncbi:transglutaminase family protein [Microbacterium marinilacus]|uniref:Transglutaminase family protein n=1 Tax=Microbacterium marinilacus TaxID=415209 RepID=A0ABP7BK98_9MICO|nr:transglutaminase family protein [Microbacterium marinilacus]MBY0689760.1 transglutaminase family protein [Microbacterium marinilacus]